MDRERFRHIEELYNSAVERSPAERVALLAQADPDIREQVEVLLAQSSDSALLDQPIDDLLGESTLTQLPTGAWLGHFQIEAMLGRGGMGVVYRAKDTKLGRDVAIKVLPDSFAHDHDRLARFNREARVLASLNHPNIGHIYGIESQALVMELVEGETLGSLIKRGPLPIETALSHARQIAEALEAAHEKGIIHRDLKPANIMVTPAGLVKVLDFGLAKAEALPAAGDPAESPTAMLTSTRAGVILGTAAYMSPEQARGAKVDKRSDIWAFGVVLYEMLTGQRLFKGATTTEIIQEVLTKEPQWDRVPAKVRRLLRSCLEKDPRRRLRDIGDVWRQLEETAQGVSTALPAGDPLATALAAGETPSPELVAGATDRQALRPTAVLACLIAILACLAAIPFLQSQEAWIAKTPFENSPDALVQKARDTARGLGYPEKPFDSAFGMHYAADYLLDLDQHGGKSIITLAHLATGQPAPILFWYRTSPRYMLAGVFGDDGTVTPDDPDMDLSGMVKLELDPQGHLVSFAAVPPQLDESPSSPKPLDGNALLTAAGLDPARFKAVEPHWSPLANCDQRAAWIGTYPSDPNPLRVEAASWRGKLVYFALISPWTRADRMQHEKAPVNQRVFLVVVLSVLCALVIGACLLARHNVRLGRADSRNAFRLSGFLFVLGMASWALSAHHMASARELIVFMMGLSINLLGSALIWVLYVALEPFVRKRWPQAMISWTRVLSGRLRDPVVGGHLLVGIFFGVFSALATEITSFVNIHSSGVPSQAVQLDTLRGVVPVASGLIGTLPNSILSTVGIFLLLFVFRLIFRKEWLTAVAFVLFFVALGSLAHADSVLITLPIRLLQFSVMLYVMLRCGLFAYVVGAWVASVLVLFPITTDFSAWYAGNALFALACIAVMTGYAFHTALGGRPLFKMEFLEE